MGFWLWILIPFVLVAAFVHDRRHKGTRIGFRSQQPTTNADSLGVAQARPITPASPAGAQA